MEKANNNALMSGNRKNKAAGLDSTHSSAFLCPKTLPHFNSEKMLSKIKSYSFDKRQNFKNG